MPPSPKNDAQFCIQTFTRLVQITEKPAYSHLHSDSIPQSAWQSELSTLNRFHTLARSLPSPRFTEEVVRVQRTLLQHIHDEAYLACVFLENSYDIETPASETSVSETSASETPASSSEKLKPHSHLITCLSLTADWINGQLPQLGPLGNALLGWIDLCEKRLDRAEGLEHQMGAAALVLNEWVGKVAGEELAAKSAKLEMVWMRGRLGMCEGLFLRSWGCCRGDGGGVLGQRKGGRDDGDGGGDVVLVYFSQME
ncbi:MAG: hypothetical protein Q9195_006137 [Heterodermia aff. obscurata]